MHEEWTAARAGQADLVHLVRPTDRIAVGPIAVLVLVAGGAATTKSLLIAGDRWSTGAQLALLAAVVLASGAVLAIAPPAPGPAISRPTRAARAVGLLRLPSETTAAERAPGRSGERVAVIVPLVLSVVVAAIGVGLLSQAGHVDLGMLVDLVLLVALAEELIYRGAVLALAHRALPPIAAELVTTVAFGLSHLGNAGGPGRVLGPMAGGLAFSWLRHRSRSLAGPVAGHLATNLPGRIWGAG